MRYEQNQLCSRASFWLPTILCTEPRDPRLQENIQHVCYKLQFHGQYRVLRSRHCCCMPFAPDHDVNHMLITHKSVLMEYNLARVCGDVQHAEMSNHYTARKTLPVALGGLLPGCSQSTDGSWCFQKHNIPMFNTRTPFYSKAVSE